MSNGNRPVLTGLELTPDGERVLQTADGMGVFLDTYFGVGAWAHDQRDDIWITVDRDHVGPGRAFFTFRRGGDWRPLFVPLGELQ